MKELPFCGLIMRCEGEYLTPEVVVQLKDVFEKQEPFILIRARFYNKITIEKESGSIMASFILGQVMPERDYNDDNPPPMGADW